MQAPHRIHRCFEGRNINFGSLMVPPFNLPGEFTLRAFLNGRLDLSQAENVGKLISAKSTAAADAALAGIQAS